MLPVPYWKSIREKCNRKTHVELKLGVELLVGDDVDLRELGVHVARVGGHPDERGLAVGLARGLRVVVKVVAHLVHQLHQVDLGAGEGNL